MGGWVGGSLMMEVENNFNIHKVQALQRACDDVK